MPSLLLRLLLLAGALFVQHAVAQGDIPYRVTAPAGGNFDQRVLPGATASLSFTLTNQSGNTGSAVLAGYFDSRSTALEGYVFTATDPMRCGAPALQPTEHETAIAFRIGPLAPNETLTCSYQVTRTAASVDDLRFLLCGPLSPTYNLSCGRVFRIGTLPDLALSVEHAAVFGDGRQLVRLRVSNPGPVDVASRVVTTDCREFEGGAIATASFSVERDFPGACATSADSEICLNFTGVNSFAYGFDIGPIAAGGTVSCLLLLRPRAPARVTIPGPADLYFLGDHMLRSDGGDAFDANAANDLTLLGLLPQAAAVVPIPAAARVAIAVLLGLTGLAAMRRRRRTT